MRLPLLVPIVAGALAFGLGPAAVADPGVPTPYLHKIEVGTPGKGVDFARGRHPITVGGLRLKPCKVVANAYCGHIRREWRQGFPAFGALRVGFAFVPARNTKKPALGTFVPHEGGPGYSTTGSGAAYAQMYGPLLKRRNMLLVDQRGTGRSAALDCPALQNLKIAYSVAAGRCGRGLGTRSSEYSTTRSADDLAAVIKRLQLGKVDLYGDSYGTFFAQVFAGRHPGLLRTIVLDSAYPTSGETAWYPTQGPAMRSSFVKVCRRSPACRGHGVGFVPAVRRVLRTVKHHPWHGVSHDGDGRRVRVKVTGKALVTTAFNATYGPYAYRELIAALRSALHGDKAPLFRLIAEAEGGSSNGGPVGAYSEGLDAAVSCHDYPQLYDMTADPATRLAEYQQALQGEEASRPKVYAPFTVPQYAHSDWEELDWCTRWPVASTDNPAGPPTPPGGVYPNVPTLILSGELDSITTPAEGALVAAEFPRSRQIKIANSFHVTAMGDTDHCAVRIMRHFVSKPFHWPHQRCASRVPPVRTMGIFPKTVYGLPAARGHGTGLSLRVAPAAAATVADLLDRWWNNYSGHDVGLRGGHWSYTGDRTVVFHLHKVKLTTDLAVSGTVHWRRFKNVIRASLKVSAHGDTGVLTGHWNTRALGARATMRGTFDNQPVLVTFRAP